MIPSLRVVSIGDINIDWSIGVGSLDAAIGSLWREDTNCIHSYFGGSGLIFSVAAKTAGFQSFLLGKVGNDAFGVAARDFLESRGVVPVLAVDEREDTGKVFVIRDDQDRKVMIAHRGANALLTQDEIDLELVKSCEALFISGYALLSPPQCQAVLSAARASRNAGKCVAFDVVPHRVFGTPLRPEYEECLSLANAVFIEAGTARRMLHHDRIDTDAIVEELRRRHDLVVLRITNDAEIVATNAAITTLDTGYSSADQKLGYLDRLAATRLFSYFQRE